MRTSNCANIRADTGWA